jgi:hypothetical protein
VSDAPSVYCGLCGLALAEGDHVPCAQRLELEPPRYCRACARRMKVQVDPVGWTAECVEHGVTTG